MDLLFTFDNILTYVFGTSNQKALGKGFGKQVYSLSSRASPGKPFRRNRWLKSGGGKGPRSASFKRQNRRQEGTRAVKAAPLRVFLSKGGCFSAESLPFPGPNRQKAFPIPPSFWLLGMPLAEKAAPPEEPRPLRVMPPLHKAARACW